MTRIRLAHKSMFFRIVTSTLILSLISAQPVAIACGWWGDGENDDEEAVVIRPGVKATVPDVSPIEAMRIYEHSNDAEELTRTANALLRSPADSADFQLGIKLLERAAGLGFAPAQNNLGTLYEKGKGVPKDNAQAAMWFKQAARQGEAHAQHSLGTMYAEGRGVNKDPSKADYWIRLSAQNGHAGALSDLKN